jgi:CheY-like chemotaxis protein
VKPVILVVEDEAKTRQTLVLYLEHAGFAVVEAADGPSALASAARRARTWSCSIACFPGSTASRSAGACASTRPCPSSS